MRLPRFDTAAHVFVHDVESPELTEEDHHHLLRALRLRSGDEVIACDGAGRWRACRLNPTNDAGVLEVEGPIQLEDRVQPPICVAFAIVKSAKPEWVVQKLTEIGVDRIVPFVAARSVVTWDSVRARRAVLRLRRIARETGMQSRRTWLPEVADLADFEEVLKSCRSQLSLAAPGGDPPSLQRPTVLVGPEGGWSPEELAAAPALVSLGASILRAETASIVSGALLCALRSRLVDKARVGGRSTV